MQMWIQQRKMSVVRAMNEEAMNEFVLQGEESAEDSIESFGEPLTENEKRIYKMAYWLGWRDARANLSFQGFLETNFI